MTWHSRSFVAWIRSIGVFAKAPPNLLIELSVAFRSIYFPPGEQLQSRGDDSATASLLVLQRGVVRCTAAGLPMRLHFAGRSGSLLFGIEALRPGCRAAQTVVSVGPVRAHALRCYAFAALVAGFPAFLPHVRRVALRHCLAWRLRNLVDAMHRVRDAVAAAPKGAVLHLSDLTDAALETQEGAALIDASPALRMSTAQRAQLLAAVAGGGDHVTVQFALLAAKLAAPEHFERVEVACMVVQRMWRGHAARKQAARAASRRRTAARLSRLLLTRSSSFATLGDASSHTRLSRGDLVGEMADAAAGSGYDSPQLKWVANALGGGAEEALAAQQHQALQAAVTQAELAAVKATLAELVALLKGTPLPPGGVAALAEGGQRVAAASQERMNPACGGSPADDAGPRLGQTHPAHAAADDR